MRYYSLNHDYAGRRRKKSKPKGEVYGKYTPPKFTEMSTAKQPTYADVRRAEAKQYSSRTDTAGCSLGSGNKVESQKYTGDYVIGIETMHKSNAVPVTNSKHATEISEMGK